MKEEEKTATNNGNELEQVSKGEIMFTIDLMALLNRINDLENETKELRGLIRESEKRVGKEIEEVRELAGDAIPKLEGGKLVFESYDDKGDVVYGHVDADIHSDQPAT